MAQEDQQVDPGMVSNTSQAEKDAGVMIEEEGQPTTNSEFPTLEDGKSFRESRGGSKKRPLPTQEPKDDDDDDDDDENDGCDEFLSASTTTRDLPEGVSMVWENNEHHSLIVTFSSSSLTRMGPQSPDDDPDNDVIHEEPHPKTQQPIPVSSETTMRRILLCMVGRAKIKCLIGKVEILGHILTPDVPEISVSSPYWSSWLTMEVDLPTGSHSTTTTTTVDITTTNRTIEATQIRMTSVRGLPSFRLANPLRPTIIPPSWRTTVQQIVQDIHSISRPQKESLEDDSPFLRIDESIIMISGAKGVGKSTLMRYMTNQFLGNDVCGGDAASWKESEMKTTPIPAVAILDADVGQPELAPPGLLTLSLRRRPLLKPPYWNLCNSTTNDSKHKKDDPNNGDKNNEDQNDEDGEQEALQSVFFGAVTSKVDPTRYLESVKRLIQAYRDYVDQTTDNIPLIINLDGWIKGMGYEILSCLIADTRPSHICQIVGDTKAKTFDLSQVLSTDDDDPSSLKNESNGESENKQHTQLFYLDVCTKFVSPFMIPSSSLRTLRLCAYFGPQLFDLWDSLDFVSAKQLQTGWSGDEECCLARTLAKERPYCVPFEAVECIHSNTELNRDFLDSSTSSSRLAHTSTSSSMTMILQAMNGSVVGLCTEGQGDCLGLGIVRSIDWDRRCMFILTPVPCDLLSQIKVLVCGNIPLPPPMVFQGVYAESFPYLTTTTTTMTTGTNPTNSIPIGAATHFDARSGDKRNPNLQMYKILGSEPMKSRNNISRRSFVGKK